MPYSVSTVNIPQTSVEIQDAINRFTNQGNQKLVCVAVDPSTNPPRLILVREGRGDGSSRKG